MNIISMYLTWWRGILHWVGLPKVNVYKPTYAEVFTTLTSWRISRCFIAYEVLCGNPLTTQAKLAEDYLHKVAEDHSWDYDIFMDIIDEEYTCTYLK